MEIFLDIETIPCQDEGLKVLIAETVKPPATMSVQATIDKWTAEKKPEAIEQAVLRTGLDGTFGMIAMIGLATEDGKPKILADTDALKGKNWVSAECAALNKLNAEIREALVKADPHDRGSLRFIGHNILGFDIRFLWQRYVINGIRPFLGFPVSTRYSGDKVFDTMTEWHPDRDKRISLDKLCKVLKVQTPKSEMTGMDVWPKLLAGEVQAVIDYCHGDIEALRACYRKMRFE